MIWFDGLTAWAICVTAFLVLNHKIHSTKPPRELAALSCLSEMSLHE